MKFNGIERLMEDADAQASRELVATVPEGGVMVELGCCQGGSLASVADLIREKRLRVWAVDLWDTGVDCHDPSLKGFFSNMLLNFSRNMKTFGLDPYIVCGNSEKLARMLPTEADLIFIDADHSYEWVKRDINALYPKVRSGGILSGHDYGNENIGVKKAVDEVFGEGCWILGTWVWKKVKP